MLKELTTKSSGAFTDFGELERLTKEGLNLLEVTYSTSGISQPRKGQGVFLALDPLPFTSFYYGMTINYLCSGERELLLTVTIPVKMKTYTKATAMGRASTHATTYCARFAALRRTSIRFARLRSSSRRASVWQWHHAAHRPRSGSGKTDI